ISWQSVPQQTNRLVDFLIEHPVDCAILFSSDGKKTAIRETDGHTLGSGKNEIHTVIAEVVFTDDAQYAGMYATNPSNLRNKFHNVCAEFESMGVGIVPIDSETSVNLHRKYEKEFPWYNQLYTIWGSHPAFATKTLSSKPGVNHTSDLFGLTHPSG
ncbi:hypothetical protein CY34DRAFT_60753, partial [Suillus luteus UH-Slu-Lm8-n1]